MKTSLEALDGYFARPWNMGVAFHAVKTTDQSTIASGAVVTFDKELLDVGNGYDVSTSVYTVPTFGLYRIDVMIICGKVTNDFRLFVNGVDTKLSASTYEIEGNSNSYPSDFQGSGAILNAILYLDAGDEQCINQIFAALRRCTRLTG